MLRKDLTAVLPNICSFLSSMGWPESTVSYAAEGGIDWKAPQGTVKGSIARDVSYLGNLIVNSLVKYVCIL